MFRIALLILATTAMLLAGGIEGEVVIKRKLSRRTVTATAGTYHRGTAVELASEPVDDPLIFERTHVVVYLEGRSPSTPVNATLEQKNRRFTEDFL